MNTIEKISAWVICLCSRNHDETWMKGSRIRTIRGMGTITGGTIHVRLDTPYRSPNGAMNTGFSHNLDNTNVKPLSQ